MQSHGWLEPQVTHQFLCLSIHQCAYEWPGSPLRCFRWLLLQPDQANSSVPGKPPAPPDYHAVHRRAVLPDPWPAPVHSGQHTPTMCRFHCESGGKHRLRRHFYTQVGMSEPLCTIQHIRFGRDRHRYRCSPCLVHGHSLVLPYPQGPCFSLSLPAALP